MKSSCLVSLFLLKSVDFKGSTTGSLDTLIILGYWLNHIELFTVGGNVINCDENIYANIISYYFHIYKFWGEM